MLKQRFWKGLKSDELKNATRVCYENKEDFETLRKKARFEEEELKAYSAEKQTEKHETVVHQQRTEKEKPNEQTKMLQQLLEKMTKMEKEVEQLKRRNQPVDYQRTYANRGNNRRGRSNYRNYGHRGGNTNQSRRGQDQSNSAGLN